MACDGLCVSINLEFLDCGTAGGAESVAPNPEVKWVWGSSSSFCKGGSTGLISYFQRAGDAYLCEELRQRPGRDNL
jgi:hypothetical protein